MSAFGIDVSHYQGKIDWKKVKESGHGDFAIVKAMYEGSRRADEYFEKNYKGCLANQIPIGIYIFVATNSIMDPGKDVERILQIIQGRRLDLGIWLDYESEALKKAGKQKIKELAYFYAKKFENEGYPVGIYCNHYWYVSLIDPEMKKDFNFWIARYKKQDDGLYNENSTLSPKKYARFWQYSSKGKVSGIGGNVDLDIAFENLEQSKKSIHEIAAEVIAGKYGNGRERILNLSKAGYNPLEVQKEVNRILKKI